MVSALLEINRSILENPKPLSLNFKALLNYDTLDGLLKALVD